MSSPQLLILKGAISEMAEDDQRKILNYAISIKNIVEEGGQHAAIALALASLQFGEQHEDLHRN